MKQEEAICDRPSSMLIWVIGFPTGLYTGIAFTSTLDVETAGKSWPEVDRVGTSSFLTAAGLVVSLDADL